MSQDGASRLDLRRLLAAVEDAPPVAVADVLGECLADAFGASDVTFLIADFSGGALIRLGHAASPAATRTQGDETAERIALADTPHGRALASQTVVVDRDSGPARLYAPVTSRGEAIGLLELVLRAPPDDRMLADV